MTAMYEHGSDTARTTYDRDRHQAATVTPSDITDINGREPTDHDRAVKAAAYNASRREAEQLLGGVLTTRERPRGDSDVLVHPNAGTRR